MKKLFDKNQNTFAIICIVIYVVGFSFTENMSKSIGFPSLLSLIFAIIAIAVLVTFAKKNQLTKYMGLCAFKGDYRKFLFFIPVFLLPIVNIWSGLTIEPNAAEAFMTGGAKGAAGIVEEIIFRGLLFTSMLKTDKLKSAVIVSSLTFGIGHIVNLLNGAALFDTLCQIIYAVAIGFCFTMLFYRSGTIIPCIISHFIINFLSPFGADPENYQLMGVINTVFLTAVGLGYGIYLAKLPKTSQAER